MRDITKPERPVKELLILFRYIYNIYIYILMIIPTLQKNKITEIIYLTQVC